MIITQHEGFEVIATDNGYPAALVVRDMVSLVFHNVTDAVDWAYDTRLGADIPQGYDIKIKTGVAANLAAAVFQSAINNRQKQWKR